MTGQERGLGDAAPSPWPVCASQQDRQSGRDGHRDGRVDRLPGTDVDPRMRAEAVGGRAGSRVAWCRRPAAAAHDEQQQPDGAHDLHRRARTGEPAATRSSSRPSTGATTSRVIGSYRPRQAGLLPQAVEGERPRGQPRPRARVEQTARRVVSTSPCRPGRRASRSRGRRRGRPGCHRSRLAHPQPGWAGSASTVDRPSRSGQPARWRSDTRCGQRPLLATASPCSRDEPEDRREIHLSGPRPGADRAAADEQPGGAPAGEEADRQDGDVSHSTSRGLRLPARASPGGHQRDRADDEPRQDEHGPCHASSCRVPDGSWSRRPRRGTAVTSSCAGRGSAAPARRPASRRGRAAARHGRRFRRGRQLPHGLLEQVELSPLVLKVGRHHSVPAAPSRNTPPMPAEMT